MGWGHADCTRLTLLMLVASRDVLDLEVRRRLYEHVGRFPGLHLREVARSLDIHPNHAKYHLERLEQHNLISSRKEDGYWRFWPKEQGSTGYRDRLSRQDKAALSVLRRPVPFHVTLLLLDQESVSHGDLLEDVHVSHSTLHYHMDKMQQSGLVVSQKVSRQRIYRLADPDRIVALLARHRPPPNLVHRFLDAWEQLVADAETLSPLVERKATGRLRLSIRPRKRDMER